MVMRKSHKTSVETTLKMSEGESVRRFSLLVSSKVNPEISTAKLVENLKTLDVWHIEVGEEHWKEGSFRQDKESRWHCLLIFCTMEEPEVEEMVKTGFAIDAYYEVWPEEEIDPLFEPKVWEKYDPVKNVVMKDTDLYSAGIWRQE
jgi:hypothetical protein